jgi:alpha-tubulin suppressor-like RCC1 family protein
MIQPECRSAGLVWTVAVCFLLLASGAAGQDEARWAADMQQAASARQSGQLPEAEKLLKAALAEAEKFGPTDHHVTVTLDALGTYYYTTGTFVEALPVYLRMLEIRERVLGPHHVMVSNALQNAAVIESLLKKGPEAEAHGERALAIAEQAAAGLTGITAIAAGSNHTCAIVGDGKVLCWGSNLNGQLGVPSPAVSSFPVELPGVRNATALAAGGYFTCALLADHTVTCWGENNLGQAGAPASRSVPPRPVAGISGARAISAGSEHACALLESGTVKCWGGNQRGQLGNGGIADSAVPVDVPAIRDARAIGAGGHHTCAATADGVSCWGTFVSGATPLVNPVRVPGLTGNVAALAAGSNFACALLNDGSVSCWWGAKPAAPGTAATAPFTAAETIAGASPSRALAAGYAHTCSLLADGTIRCWGNNREGQLGNGQTTNSAAPVAVQGIKTATAIAAGLAHTCAVLADRTAQCWGSDSWGAPQGILFGLKSTSPVIVGRDESSLVSALNILADVYRNDAKYDKAEPLYLRTLQLLEKLRGPDNENMAPVLNGYAEMLRKAGRAEDAAKVEARAQTILFKPTLTDVPTAPPAVRQ